MNSLLTGLQFDNCRKWLKQRHQQDFLYLLMCAFILGVACAVLFGFAEFCLLPMLVAVLLAAAAAVVWRLSAVFYIPLFLLGIMWGGLDELQTESFAVAADEAVFFSGTVTEVYDNEENYFAQLAEFSTDAKTFVMRGRTDDGWQGKLMIMGSSAEVRPGDKLELAAIVQPFVQTENFGVLPNEYLLNNGIGAAAVAVQSAMHFTKLASPYTPLNLGIAVRQLVYDNMTELPAMQQALLKGIGFGETGMLTNGHKAVLQQTGIMHVFAVSGMHIAYVTMLAGAVLEFVRRRLRLGYQFVVIGTIAVVLCFCLVVGFTPSVVRSAIMSVAALLSLLLLRRHTAGHALIAAAFIMLLYQPRWLCQPGFILSFLATAGIIYTAEYWQVLLPNRALAATFAAQFMVIPVVAYFFNTVSFIGFVISPIIALGSGIVVILILLAVFLAPFGLALVTLSGAGILAELMYKLAELFAALPGSFTYTPRPGIAAMVVYYLLLAAAYVILARYKNDREDERNERPEEPAKELSQGQAHL